MSRQCFQSYDRGYERCDEKQAPESGRLVKHKDPYQYCANSSNARPHRIGGAQRKSLRGFCQQDHTHKGNDNEATHPSPPFKAFYSSGSAQAIGKTYLAQPGDNQDNPIHL